MKRKNKNVYFKSFILFIGFCITCFIIYKYFFSNKTSSIYFLDSKNNILGGTLFQKQIISSKIESFIGNYQISFNREKKDKSIKAIIVPHAGLFYSGDIANKAYSQIDWNHYDKIVILSTNHYSSKKIKTLEETKTFVLVPENNSFFLYKQKYYFKNIEEDNLFIKDNLAFKDEHSWAIQMPFIQKIENIYLFLVGKYDEQQKKYIQNLIKQNKTLLIVNTDLYHCGKKFNNVCHQPDKINQETIKNIISNEPLKKDSVCGTYVMQLFNSIFESLNIKYKEHFYDTSSSKSLNKDSSVGYLSMIFTSQQKIFQDNLKELLQIPRKTMEKYYELDEIHISSQTEYNHKFGVFITIENSNNGRLRGCIGTFLQTNKLEELISVYTLKSAKEDSRFTKNKIKREELGRLQYKINFIYPPEEMVFDVKTQTFDYENFIIGTHGITIYISEFKSSTYLANVVYELLKIYPDIVDSLHTKKLNDFSWNILLTSLKDKHDFKGPIIKVEKYKCMEYDEKANLIVY